MGEPYFPQAVIDRCFELHKEVASDDAGDEGKSQFLVAFVDFCQIDGDGFVGLQQDVADFQVVDDKRVGLKITAGDPGSHGLFFDQSWLRDIMGDGMDVEHGS